eukprot:9594346-Alexandrium_andersonii.AAC.1
MTAAFSSDGNELLTASTDQTCRLWHTATGESWRTIGPSGWRAAFAPDGVGLSALVADGSD